MKSEKDAMICQEILDLLEETFESVHGHYLDKGTSLIETLNRLSAAEASQQRGRMPETIAGHVNHLIFYIVVLQEYIADLRTGKVDWSESWKVRSVDEGEWNSLRNRLRDEYLKLRDFVSRVDEWKKGDYVGGVMAILAHSAYHLGAIRQLMEI
jgi:hypothetical protein